MSVSPISLPSGACHWAVCFSSQDGTVGPISYLSPGDTPEAAGQSLRRFYLENLPMRARLRVRLGTNSPVIETAQVLLVSSNHLLLLSAPRHC